MFLLSYVQNRRQGQCSGKLLTLLLLFVINKMDAEEDYLGVPSMDTAGGSKGRCFTPLPQSSTSSGPMDKAGDLGDMTFCMANYVKEAMQVS
jgi:hypothetical protein